MRRLQPRTSRRLRGGVLVAALALVLAPATAGAAGSHEAASTGSNEPTDSTDSDRSDGSSAPAPGPIQSRTLTESFDPDGYEGVVLDVKVAEIDVRGSGDDEIVLTLRIECEWDDPEDCRDRVDDIQIADSDWGGDLYLEIEGLGFWGSRGVHLDIDLTLPSRMPFELQLGVGEARIRDLLADVTVDVGVGEVDISMDAAAVKTVTLDNGIGESRLRFPDGKQDVSGILGGTEVFWDLGPGTHDVKVELNVGEIRVTLR